MSILQNNKARSIKVTWDLAIIALLVVVWILGTFTTDNFLTALNISQIFSNTSEIMIMATAVTFLIIAGEIDLSIAANAA